MSENYHFVGIGGIGMSALATILLQKGMEVTGSDMAASATTEQLEQRGAKIFIGHCSSHIQRPCAVVYSTAIAQENPELEQARSHNVPFLHRSELLRELMQTYRPLLVAGTHGKTTTSCLLAHLLVCAGLDPAYAVGGTIGSLNSNGGYGKGDYFVAEADESDGSFLKYSPFGAIITNIDHDHLDYWKTLEHLIGGFKRFIHSVKSQEHLLWCGDDDILGSMNLKGLSYGFEEGNDLYIKSYLQEGWKSTFDICFEGIEYSGIQVPLIGGHNVLNAAAVFGLGIKIGIPEESIRKAFSKFQGVNRRSEFKGESRGICIFDDYGHHPTEIFATLRAIKHAVFPRRLVVAFQPHRYSRTLDCLHEFAPAFTPADELILTDIYSAGEMHISGITGEAFATTVKKSAGFPVEYVPREKLSQFLANHLQKEDVLVTMGAGDITQVGPEVMELLR